jgi:hypothetical protein
MPVLKMREDIKLKLLVKNKIVGCLLILIGALSVPICEDATFFLFTLIPGIALIFARENHIL